MSAVDDEIGAAMDAQARRIYFHKIKSRARHYRKNPALSGMIDARLPGAHWRTALAIADHHLERERATPRRRFGFGGEVPLVNVLAVRLLARLERRLEARLLRRAA